MPQLGGLTGQQNLLDARVLVVGLGGLGSPAALYLAGAGIGTLGLMDSDSVETSNLHRQIIHSEGAAAAGQTKVASALASCRALNSSIAYRSYELRASPEVFLSVLREGRFDLVLDCTDNPATRYLISDACVVAGCVLVSGAAQRGEGQVVVLNCPPVPRAAEGEEEKGPCYRCVFPRPPAPEMVRGCSEIGILGHVVGVIGVLMAGDAVKILSQGKHLPRPAYADGSQEVNGVSPQNHQDQPHSYSQSHHPFPSQANSPPPPPKPQQHTMLLYNTFASDPRHQFRTIILRGRRKDCLACGDDSVLASKGQTRITVESILQGRMDYVAFCGVLADVRVLGEENRIGAREFLELQGQQHHESHGDGGKRHITRHGRHRRKRPVVVDVREEHEVELGPKLRGSVNIPLSRILRHGGRAFDELHAHTLASDVDALHDAAPPFTPDDGPGEARLGGMVDQETHVLSPISRLGPNLGGMVDQESHIPMGGVQDFVTGGGGGMLDQESHIPTVARGSDAYPQRPVARLSGDVSTDVQRRDYSYAHDGPDIGAGDADTDADADDENDNKNTGWPVYFVCQRGNDSQVAAQKLLERIRAEKEDANRSDSAGMGQWGWVGDVKGGFVAMERHQFGGPRAEVT